METFVISSKLSLSAISSYPTYEEWKPLSGVNISPDVLGSYPTYEEWKHGMDKTKQRSAGRVLILPMRNGN